MEEISRRELLKGAAALTAGLVFSRDRIALAGPGPGGGGAGGGMGGGGGTIDPPVGAWLVEPPVLHDVSQTAGVVEVNLSARRAPVDINGTTADLMTYADLTPAGGGAPVGTFPGGTIRARQGDLVRVNFKNDLPADGAVNFLGHPMYVTNLHSHGLHVTPGDNMNGTHGDNMLVMLAPGEEAVYEYDLMHQYPGTLNFYHPHIHGSVTDQMWGGMAGCLVVEDEVDTLAAHQTHLMVLKDITLAGSAPAPHTSVMQYMHGVEGDIVMMNGQVNPKVAIESGQVQRWRILNACTARFFRLSLTNHTMYVVGTEAGLLDKPYPVSEVLLSPGERIEILVRADKASSSYKFLSLPYSRMGNMGAQQVTLATLVYGRGKAKTLQALPAVVDPGAKRVSMDLTTLKRQSMALSMGQGAGYINGMTYVNHEKCFELESDLHTHEIWEVTNNSGMDHPFHHHVNRAQVLSITGGDANYRALYTTTPSWKDVTIVPKWGRIELLVPVMDYTGMTMMHCHIIEHEDIGMMGMWCIEEGMHH